MVICAVRGWAKPVTSMKQKTSVFAEGRVDGIFIADCFQCETPGSGAGLVLQGYEIIEAYHNSGQNR